jgi:hypothetical protein
MHRGGWHSSARNVRDPTPVLYSRFVNDLNLVSAQEGGATYSHQPHQVIYFQIRAESSRGGRGHSINPVAQAFPESPGALRANHPSTILSSESKRPRRHNSFPGLSSHVAVHGSGPSRPVGGRTSAAEAAARAASPKRAAGGTGGGVGRRSAFEHAGAREEGPAGSGAANPILVVPFVCAQPPHLRTHLPDQSLSRCGRGRESHPPILEVSRPVFFALSHLILCMGRPHFRGHILQPSDSFVH